jgi:cyclopropane-fatty-acyl-phospholipid synthase
MSVHHEPEARRPITLDAPLTDHSLLYGLLRRAVRRLHAGRLSIDMPGGERVDVTGPQAGPHAHLRILSRRMFWRLALHGDLGAAESYIAGEWSSPDLDALLKLALLNAAALPQAGLVRVLPRLRHELNRNTRRGSRRNIAAHYDLGNAFYSHWLDAGMNYSSGLYLSPAQTLEEAQQAKADRVSQLLELSGGETVLEIGCGWGALAERLIERHRCRVTGITLSARQLEYANQRLRERGLCRYGDLRLQDYRDVQGSYDRIVSIEMMEAVGAAYWPAYFKQVRDRLRPGGVAVLQVITIDEARYEAYRRQPDFIQQYIFPGGMLPTVEIVGREAESAGIELVRREMFGESYALSLAEWQRRFQTAWPSIAPLGFDARFKRMWEYYLAYCQAGFEAGAVSVGFYQFRKR